MPKISHSNDVACGLFLVLTAGFFLWTGRNLAGGTALSMGAGYVPRLLSAIQIVLGLVILGGGLIGRGEPLESWSFRPLAILLASIAFFALAVEPLGTPVAVIGTVLIAGSAHPATRPLESGALSLALAVFCVLLFVEALDLQLPVWPRSLGR